MSDTIDKLIRLARGDVDVVQAAIRQAACGGVRADLGEVVRAVLRLRPSPTPLAAGENAEGER